MVGSCSLPVAVLPTIQVQRVMIQHKQNLTTGCSCPPCSSPPPTRPCCPHSCWRRTVLAHYAKSVVYAAHIIFSSLYHACAGQIYSLCVLNVTILRFSDIFTHILATWVTLLAMAPLPPSFRSVLHVIGATGMDCIIINYFSNPPLH